LLDKGTTVAGYRIDGALGEGGMGVVYRATQLSLNRSVALKILSSDLGDDEGFRERFRREGLLQAAIDHPHIVTVYDTGETEHGLFLAMRMVRGPTLKDMILGRELDPGRSLRILTQVAEALDTAHDVGLTHRDIKPQNILIGSRDHAYLADFGLTKAPDEAGRLTATGQFVGTIDYVSPEQIQGEPATARSDIYALTGVLYECLVGSVPFPKPAEAAVVYAHIAEPPPQPTADRPELPKAIDEVVAKGMAKDPGDRYGSAGELLAAAAQAFGSSVQTAGTPPGPVPSAEGAGVRGNGSPTEPAGTPLRSPEELAAGVTAASPIQSTPTTPAKVPAGATTPATPVEAPARRRALPVAALVAGLAVVGAIAGFVLGGSGGSEGESADLGSSASAGTLAVSFPDGWKRVAQEPTIPGLDFSQPIVLAPPSPAGARVEAGGTDGTGPTLLPKPFLAALKAPPKSDDAVQLGSLQAFRYSNLTPAGAPGPVTVYTAPTTEGVATVACASPAGPPDAAFLRECERVAGTLELTSGKPLALGPREEYGKAVGGALTRLDSSAASGAKRLSAARTPAGQAAASRALAATYARAVRQVRAAPDGPFESAAHTQLVNSLRRVATGYSSAARAAARGDRGAYAAARRRVRRGGAALRRAQAGLTALGYKVEN
jgi:hypothetical protein